MGQRVSVLADPRRYHDDDKDDDVCHRQGNQDEDEDELIDSEKEREESRKFERKLAQNRRWPPLSTESPAA